MPHISQYAIHARARIKRTAQPDPSMDLGSALRYKTKTEYYNRLNTMAHPNTGVPHTPYVSLM